MPNFTIECPCGHIEHQDGTTIILFWARRDDDSWHGYCRECIERGDWTEIDTRVMPYIESTRLIAKVY